MKQGRGRSLGARLSIVLAFAPFLLLAGCARFGKIEPGTAAAPAAPTGGLDISTQYSYSSGPRTGYNTLEVYLRNDGPKPLAFRTLCLNDRWLALPKAAVRLPKSQTAMSISVDGMEVPLNATRLPKDEDLTWWQFYPAAEVAPGETVVLQLNFRRLPTFRRVLTLTDSTGQTNNVILPRFRVPQKLITAVTYPLDYGKIYVQYESKSPPKRLWVNNKVADFTVLRSPEPNTPDMLAAKSPCPIATGTPLHLRMEFADGDSRQALVRALSGISLDTPADAGPSARRARELGLDPEPVVSMIPYDVTCDDVRTEIGNSAPAIVPERLREYREDAHRLSGIGYCTAMYPELWNVYGQISDVVFAKPYRLGWGYNPNRFIEEEEEVIENARLTARPRPFLWIPERFSKRGRFLEPQEMETLAWMSIIRGSKGIRYHFWKNPGPDPFAGCALLLPALTNLNREIRARRDLLSPLTLVSERILGDEQNGWVKVYTAWAGDQGMLVMVRNMRYRTDPSADDEGRSPRFRVPAKVDMAVLVSLPQWVKYQGVSDLLTGDEIPAVEKDGQIEAKVGGLDAFRLLWLPNGSMAMRREADTAKKAGDALWK